MYVLTSYHVRQFITADAASLCAAVQLSLSELVHWMPWCSAEYGLAQAESWVVFSQQAWAARTDFPLGIFETASGTVVGGTGINHISRANDTGNIGYWVSTPHTRRGVARFAAQEAARLGFGELGLTRLEIVTPPHNVACPPVAESLGATRECHARNRLVVGGVPRDAIDTWGRPTSARSHSCERASASWGCPSRHSVRIWPNQRCHVGDRSHLMQARQDAGNHGGYHKLLRDTPLDQLDVVGRILRCRS